jgi:hypothetical protein
MPLPLVCTYAHIHLVLLVRVHLCGLCMLVPRCGLLIEVQSEAVGLTPSFGRVCDALCANVSRARFGCCFPETFACREIDLGLGL